jgi:hypothetical protein
MSKGKGGGSKSSGGSNNNRANGKAYKKFIKVYDPEKKRLVRIPNPKG